MSGDVWKSEALVRKYLTGIRGAIPMAAEQIAIMSRIVDAGARDVGDIADLGCGGGALASVLLERYPDARATLVDFSEPMIAEARKSLASCGDACEYVLADLSEPRWVATVERRSPFDVVVSGYAIHHLTDDRKRDLYGEVFGLLRSGGVFVNVDHVKSATTWLEETSDEMIVDSLFAFHTERGSGKTRREVADEFVHRPDKAANILAPVEDQCDWLRELGFVDVDCYFKVLELAVFGGRKPAA